MKRSLIVGAIATLAAGTAMAQSSVTLYGRVNTTVEQQKNWAVDGKQTVLANNASRLGFQGSEDLGGGLKANFFLEHRFNSDTGTASGDFWAGDSWVGLSGNFGALRLGRLISAAYYATADFISLHNHDTGTSSDFLYTYLSSNKNTVAYTTPDIGGFTLEGSVSAGEGTDIEKVYQLALNGKVGAFALGAGWEKQAEFDNQQFAVRVLGDFGSFLVGAYYQLSKIEEARGVTGADWGKRNAFRLSGAYLFGASELHLNVGYADAWDNIDNSKAKQYTVAYNYNLSKRTKVYAYYTKVDNKSGFSYAGVSGFGPTTGALDPSAIAVGIRHNF